MSQDYLHDGQNQIGPFSIDELMRKNISGETFVWKEGMADWVKAKEIPDLKEIFGNTPPPFRASVNNPKPPLTSAGTKEASGTYKTGNWIGRNLKLTFFILALVVLAAYLFYVNRSRSDYSYSPFQDSLTLPREKTPEELRMELQTKEKENPTEYLKPALTRRKNLIGENVFEGTITNTASAASFKDIAIKIVYLSKTRSVIGYHEFVVYEVIGPQQTVSIRKVKFFPPEDTDEYRFDITSAIPVE